MQRPGIRHIIWLGISVLLGATAVLVYALGARPAPHLPGGGIAGYALGLAALALILVASAYWVRNRHVPKDWREPGPTSGGATTASVAQARERLADLQANTAEHDEGLVSFRIAARRVLKELGLARTYRVIVRRQADGKPQVRMEPKEPLAALSNWLLAHQYLGATSLLIAGFHCGFQVRSVLGGVILCLLTLVVISGTVGTVLYALIPPKLTALEAAMRSGQAADVATAQARKRRYEGALKSWLYLHTPLTVSLLAILLVHVVVVIYF